MSSWNISSLLVHSCSFHSRGGFWRFRTASFYSPLGRSRRSTRVCGPKTFAYFKLYSKQIFGNRISWRISPLPIYQTLPYQTVAKHNNKKSVQGVLFKIFQRIISRSNRVHFAPATLQNKHQREDEILKPINRHWTKSKKQCAYLATTWLGWPVRSPSRCAQRCGRWWPVSSSCRYELMTATSLVLCIARTGHSRPARKQAATDHSSTAAPKDKSSFCIRLGWISRNRVWGPQCEKSRKRLESVKTRC